MAKKGETLLKLKHKFSLSIIIIIFCTFPINAQWSIGLNGGINLGNMEKSNQISEAESSLRTGLVIGGAVKYKISRIFNLLIQIRYIQKGVNVKVNSPTNSAKGGDYFNYLEIPFYFITRISDDKLNPFLFGGISLSYLLNAKEEGTSNGEKFSYDITEGYERTDFTVDIGIGLEYLFSSNTSYLFSINYSYSLSDILIYKDATHYHRGIQLLFGILYSL